MSSTTLPVPKKAFAINLVGEDVDTLNQVVASVAKFKPEWKMDANAILTTLAIDFLSGNEPVDDLVRIIASNREKALYQEIKELKAMRKGPKEPKETK